MTESICLGVWSLNSLFSSRFPRKTCPLKIYEQADLPSGCSRKHERAVEKYACALRLSPRAFAPHMISVQVEGKSHFGLEEGEYDVCHKFILYL